jgi:uncharacterized protein
MPALARAAIGDSLLNVVTGIGTAKDPRTSTRYHLRLLEKNVLEHICRGDWMARRLVDLPTHDATREVANVADEQQERSGPQGS